MELYREEDYQSAKSGMWKRLIILMIILGLTVAALIVFVGPVRNQFLAIAACAIGGCVFLFVLSTKALPWVNYWRYVSDIRKGRAHELDCTFKELSDAEKVSDGVVFHPFLVELDPVEKPDDRVGKDAKNADTERMLLWDADKTAPDLKPGDRLHVRSFGNYIIALEVR